MKSLIIVLLALVSFSVNSQSLEEFMAYESITDVVDVPMSKDQLLTDGANAENLKLANFINGYGDSGVDVYLNQLEKKWFYGVDLYVAEDMDSISEEIKKDSGAYFRSPSTRNVVVSVSTKSGYYSVLVFSFL